MKQFGMLNMVAVVTALTVGALHADVLTLTSGKRVDGAVVFETATEVQLQTSVGKITYAMSQIASIERTGRVPDEVLAETAVKERRYKAALELMVKAKAHVTPGSEADKRISAKITRLELVIPEYTELQAAEQYARAEQAFRAEDFDVAFAILESGGNDLFTNSAQQERASKLLAKVCVGRGKNAQDRQDWVGSLEQFKAATEADPQYVEAWMLYGSTLLQDRNTNAAGFDILEVWLSKGKAILPPAEQYGYNLLLGQELRDRREYTRAIPYFGECLKLVDAVVSNGAEAYDALAECLLRLDKVQWSTINPREYLGLLEQVRGGSGDSFYLLKSVLMGHNGQYKDAWDTLRIHLSQKSRAQRRSLITEAWVRGELGQSDDVLQEFRDYGLNVDRYDWEAMSMQAWLYMLENNNDDATTAAEAAIVAAPQEWAPAYVLAEAAYMHSLGFEEKCTLTDSFFRGQSDLEVARKALTRARAIAPGTPDNYILTARVLVGQKEYETAAKYLDETQKFLDDVKNDNYYMQRQRQQLLLAKADLAFAKGEREAADTLIEEAMAVLPSSQAPLAQRIGLDWKAIKEAYITESDTTVTLVNETLARVNQYLSNPGPVTIVMRKLQKNLRMMGSGAELEGALRDELGGGSAFADTPPAMDFTAPTATDEATSQPETMADPTLGMTPPADPNVAPEMPGMPGMPPAALP